MGATNVLAVLRNWPNLEHKEMRALVYMAVKSMDDDVPPRYWGGWENLAVVLGHGTSKPETARVLTNRTLSALSKAGAIVSSGQARQGVRAEYALALHPSLTCIPTGRGRNIVWQQVSNPNNTEGNGKDPGAGLSPSGTVTVPQGGTLTVPLPVTATVPSPVTPTVPPMNNYQEEHQEYIEESNHLGSLNPPAHGFGQNETPDKKNPSTQAKPNRIRLDTNAEVEDERRRQLDKLEQLMAKEAS